MSNFANVYLGAAPNDETGDPLRNAFDKINRNFAYLKVLFSVKVYAIPLGISL